MRYWIGAYALFLAGWAQATEGVYQRGDFKFEAGPKPAHVIERSIPERWDPAAPGASGATWRSWLYDRQVDRRGQAASVYVDYAYEAKTASLLGDAGKYQITFNPDYQGLTIHRVELRRDGRWSDRLQPDHISLARRENRFEEDLADGEVTALIVLDDVRVDDVVRIAYTITGSNPVLAGQDSDTMYFGWGSPLLDAHFRMIDDPGTRFVVRREHGAPEASQRETDGGAEIQMHAHGVAATVDESNYPIWFQPYPRAQISTQRSWSDVVAWALPLYPKVDEPLPPDLEARIRAWSRLPSQGEQLTAALRAVQDEVRYFGVELGDNSHRPVAPSDTWRRRRGDCKDKAYLLSTILARLGIRGVPALTSTEEGRAVEDMIPSAYDFNHVIVRSQIEGKTVWVDPTSSQQGGDAAASDLSRYGVVLPVAEGITALEQVVAPDSVDAGTEVVESYSPAADGRDVPLEIRTTYKGWAADLRRAGFASERLSDTSRRYADYYRKRFGDLTVVREPEVSDDRGSNVLTVIERYRLADPFEAEGASVRGLTVRADTIDVPAALPTTMQRTGPLYFAWPGTYRHAVRLRIPTEWKPVFGDEHEAVDGTFFDYRRDVVVREGETKLDYSFEVRKSDVASIQASVHVGELRKVQDMLSATLRFRMPQGQDQQDRARRLRELLHNVQGGGER